MSTIVDELTYAQALAMLPPGKEIHTFLNPAGILLGANWTRWQVRRALRLYPKSLAGDQATAMGHGLVIHEKGRYVFVATRKPKP